MSDLLARTLAARWQGPRLFQATVLAVTANPDRITVSAPDGSELPQVAYLGTGPPLVGSTVQCLWSGPQILALTMAQAVSGVLIFATPYWPYVYTYDTVTKTGIAFIQPSAGAGSNRVALVANLQSNLWAAVWGASYDNGPFTQVLGTVEPLAASVASFPVPASPVSVAWSRGLMYGQSQDAATNEPNSLWAWEIATGTVVAVTVLSNLGLPFTGRAVYDPADDSVWCLQGGNPLLGYATALTQLDPVTLAVRSSVTLSGTYFATGPLACDPKVPGSIWITGTNLGSPPNGSALRVSKTTGAADITIPIYGSLGLGVIDPTRRIGISTGWTDATEADLGWFGWDLDTGAAVYAATETAVAGEQVPYLFDAGVDVANDIFGNVSFAGVRAGGQVPNQVVNGLQITSAGAFLDGELTGVASETWNGWIVGACAPQAGAVSLI